MDELKETMWSILGGLIVFILYMGPILLFFWACSNNCTLGMIIPILIYLVYMSIGIWLRHTETHYF